MSEQEIIIDEPEAIETRIDDISEPLPVVRPAGIAAEAGSLLPSDTILAGRYTVNGTFPRRSRASESYLCTWRSKPFVAKVYEQGTGFDNEASNILMQVNSPYLARVLKAGRWEDRYPFEVSPYYRNGSLEGRTFDADTICREIVPQLNRGLGALHSKGIIHGNLKPSNIMMGDDPGHFLIADYGSLLAGDTEVPELEEVQVSKDSYEITYEAPEARNGTPVPESDYFSLGIVLFVLYTGQMPVEQARTVDVLAPRFDFPADMPARLRDLIIGLTHSDLSNQKNYANPNRRWTYNEVRRWCAGDTLWVPIESFGPGPAIMPYVFGDQRYTSLGALVAAMAVNWDEGKKHVLGGKLQEFFSETDPVPAKACERAEIAAKHNPAREDAIYFESLYRLSPDLENMYWMGECLGTAEDAGLAFLKDSVTPQLDRMAERGALAGYMRARYPDDPDLARTMTRAEREYTNPHATAEERAVSRRVISRLLMNDFQFTVDGQNFDNIKELVAFCLEIRRENKQEWRELSSRLVPEPGKLEPGFEAWLLSLGKADAITSWTGGRANRNKVEPGSALRPSASSEDEWII